MSSQIVVFRQFPLCSSLRSGVGPHQGLYYQFIGPNHVSTTRQVHTLVVFRGEWLGPPPRSRAIELYTVQLLFLSF